MLINIIRMLVIIAGPVIGYTQISSDTKGILIGVGAAVLIIAVELLIDKVPLDSLIAGMLGAIIGLVAAKLLDWVIYQMDDPRLYSLAQRYSLLIKVVLAYLGLVIFVRKKSELDLLDKDLILKGPKRKLQDIKVVDTSVLIDGRIVDVCDTKFLSGIFVVPRFVLRELQAIADSGDPGRRSKGRRGMEMLSRLKENTGVNIRMFEKEYPDIPDVDAKLVVLSKELGAKILTTDFNLNKIASIQGVTILNVNDLAASLKPIVLPGEPMTIFVVKEGKERDQGVGYLDDGTMVIVEDGRRGIGKRIDVVVSSILHTSAGRMIFTRTKERDYHHDKNQPDKNTARPDGKDSN